MGIDLSQFFAETARSVNFPYKDGRGHRGPARVLVNVNAPYMAYVFNLLGRSFLRGKHITGYWAWELPQAPEEWRAGFERVHALAAPSAFVADAVRSLGGAPRIKIAPHPVMQERLRTIAPRRVPISAEAPFTIVSVANSASGFARKNPLGLVSAFKRAFPARRDVRLRMLVTNLDHYPPGRTSLLQAAHGDDRIEYEFRALDRDAYWRWYGSPDLYASLHRAEGFGLPLAEAMAMGVPVLATWWSANAEYMNQSNGLLVRHSLVAVDDPQLKYPQGGRWAEPDLSHAAELMLRALDDPHWLAEIASNARSDASRLFTQFDPF